MSITDLAPGRLFPGGIPSKRHFGTRRMPPMPTAPAARPSKTRDAVDWRAVRAALAAARSWLLPRLQAAALALKPRPRQVRLREAAIRAVLQSDFSATVVRLLAYLGALAVLALSAAQLFDAGSAAIEVEPAPREEWIDVAKPFAAFTLPMSELGNSSYGMRRHASGGGRRDIMSWGEIEGQTPHLTVEVYRPGAEFTAFDSPARELAARTGGLVAAAAIRPAGSLESKFGPVTLAQFSTEGAQPRHCLGFARPFDHPRMEITGWYCSNQSDPFARDLVACALDRLTLLAAGSDPSIGELFARADLKRNFCGERSPLFAKTPKLGPSAPPVMEMKLRGRVAAR